MTDNLARLTTALADRYANENPEAYRQSMRRLRNGRSSLAALNAPVS